MNCLSFTFSYGVHGFLVWHCYDRVVGDESWLCCSRLLWLLLWSFCLELRVFRWCSLWGLWFLVCRPAFLILIGSFASSYTLLFGRYPGTGYDYGRNIIIWDFHIICSLSWLLVLSIGIDYLFIFCLLFALFLILLCFPYITGYLSCRNSSCRSCHLCDGLFWLFLFLVLLLRILLLLIFLVLFLGLLLLLDPLSLCLVVFSLFLLLFQRLLS